MKSSTKVYVYYNKKQYGPLAWAEVLRKNLPSNTLVWTKGMKNWQTIASLQQANRPGEKQSREVSHKTVASGDLVYADFVNRLAAFLIDGLALSVASYMIGLIYSSMFWRLAFSVPELFTLFSYLLTLGISWAYFAFFESSELQATPGKILLKIKVVNEYDGRITLSTATARFFAKILSGLILIIGYLMVLWTPRRQALHDQLAKTLVINNTSTKQ
jgi:uncharacterized RDD family membrane protein YckC